MHICRTLQCQGNAASDMVSARGTRSEDHVICHSAGRTRLACDMENLIVSLLASRGLQSVD